MKSLKLNLTNLLLKTVSGKQKAIVAFLIAAVGLGALAHLSVYFTRNRS